MKTIDSNSPNFINQLQNAEPETPEELIEVLELCLQTGYKYKFYDFHVKRMIKILKGTPK